MKLYHQFIIIMMVGLLMEVHNNEGIGERIIYLFMLRLTLYFIHKRVMRNPHISFEIFLQIFCISNSVCPGFYNIKDSSLSCISFTNILPKSKKSYTDSMRFILSFTHCCLVLMQQ